MRIALIGGTGFIGSAVVRCAIERGHEPLLVHRGRRANLGGAPEIVAAREDLAAVRGALSRWRPDALIDTFAMTERDAEALLAVAAPLGAPLVVLSSQDVYAQLWRIQGLAAAPAPEPLVREESPLTPVAYPFRGVAEHDGGPDYDKKLVEAVIARGCASGAIDRATVLRLPAVYGAGDPKRRFGSFVDAIDRGRRRFEMRGGGAFRWTHAEVDDAARGVVLACEQPPRARGVRTLNVGEDETPTMRARVDAIADAMGAVLEWREAAEGEALEGEAWLLDAMPNDVVVDDSRIRAELGHREREPMSRRMERLVVALRASRGA